MSIHPDTNLGYVHLTVNDLKSSLPYYTDVLGFHVHRNENGTAHLGAGGDDLVLLTENPDAKDPGIATGLYHFAILVPSRLELARALRRLAETQVPLQGFSDHLVSEAIYLSDPDGNGIEIYRDRPRDQWTFQNGALRMASDPLDIRGILRELEADNSPSPRLAPDTKLGHMHLKIANVKRDEAFYRDVLGFDEMAILPSAAFVSAGGYHHHLGMNTWESAGAAPPPPDSIGLQYFTVRLPNSDELTRVANQVRSAGFDLEETDAGLLVRDPSKNAVVLTTQN
ncbi:MAG TPA: VOC family protein [Anaerolineae bacterium]|nr:VOC family protein [Anaerolineae bacterium]